MYLLLDPVETQSRSPAILKKWKYKCSILSSNPVFFAITFEVILRPYIKFLISKSWCLFYGVTFLLSPHLCWWIAPSLTKRILTYHHILEEKNLALSHFLTWHKSKKKAIKQAYINLNETLGIHITMMINFICHLDWILGCPDSCLNVYLCMSSRVFLEISIWIGGLCKAAQCEQASLN